MTEPTEYRTPIAALARLVAVPAHVRGRLLLAAAVATDHKTVRVLAGPGSPRYRIGLDLTIDELMARLPDAQYYEFDRQIDGDKACMVFDLEPGRMPDLPAEPEGVSPPRTREAVEAAVAAERDAFAAYAHRPATTVVINNIAFAKMMPWLTPDSPDAHPTGLKRGDIPDLCGLHVMVSTRVAPNPGFLVL